MRTCFLACFQLTPYRSHWAHPILNPSWQPSGWPAGTNLHRLATCHRGASLTSLLSTALMRRLQRRTPPPLPLVTTATSPSLTPAQPGPLSASLRAPNSITTCCPMTHRWRQTSSASPVWWATVAGSLSFHHSPWITTAAWTPSHALWTTGQSTSTITSTPSPRPFLWGTTFINNFFGGNYRAADRQNETCLLSCPLLCAVPCLHCADQWFLLLRFRPLVPARWMTTTKTKGIRWWPLPGASSTVTEESWAPSRRVLALSSLRVPYPKAWSRKYTSRCAGTTASCPPSTRRKVSAALFSCLYNLNT